MKVRDNYLLREIAGETILIPINEAAQDFQGIMSLNGTGRFLWEKLQKECTEETLVAALLDEYDAAPEQAAEDVPAFLNQLRAQHILMEQA